MYFFVIKLALAIYVTMFILGSASKQIFDQILYKRLMRYIDNQYKNLINKNPNDEWIAGINGLKKRKYVKDTNPIITNIKTRYNSDEEFSDDDMELLVGEPENLLTFDRIKKISTKVIDENKSTFYISMYNILLTMGFKILLNNGMFYELLVGLAIGLIIHMSDFIIQLFISLKKIYFDSKEQFIVEKIVNRDNKFTPRTKLIIPLVLDLIIAIVRANIYTRIIGEWFMDLSLTYLYFCIYIGYNIIENYINIIYASKENPLILILSLIYIMLSFII